MKRQADVSLMRYETVKRRRLSKSVNERNKERDEFAEDNDNGIVVLKQPNQSKFKQPIQCRQLKFKLI